MMASNVSVLLFDRWISSRNFKFALPVPVTYACKVKAEFWISADVVVLSWVPKVLFIVLLHLDWEPKQGSN